MEINTEKYAILLADDHVLIRHGIKNIIKQNETLEVIGEVGNGEELMEFLEKKTPDLLILDISMPRLAGTEAVSLVKKKYPQVKVLMLTMHKNKQYFYHSMSCGADGYLMKDDSDEELLLAIKKIQKGKTYISPILSDDFTQDVISAHRNHQATPFSGLTKREYEVLQLVVEGRTSKDVAERLCLSPRTVDHHRARLLKKFNLRNSADLVCYAVRNGFIRPE
ncbi:MAG: response regulator transcription factor [Desulfopila sp.]|jgi:DNA-binding NarL/FixJ family response regulator|nr:response regulator transcription factor [Desulfopila sp.]